MTPYRRGGSLAHDGLDDLNSPSTLSTQRHKQSGNVYNGGHFAARSVETAREQRASVSVVAVVGNHVGVR